MSRWMGRNIFLLKTFLVKTASQRNAAKRLLTDMRRDHPHLKIIIVEDELSANGPHLKLLDELKMSYIIVAKSADHKVNFLKYTNGKSTWTGVTRFLITPENVYEIIRAGRARWKIENETFHTLKNQGYDFEHNYGHGYEHLSNNMAVLMLLAFFIDQIQKGLNEVFQQLYKTVKNYSTISERVRSILNFFVFNNWDDIYRKLDYRSP